MAKGDDNTLNGSGGGNYTPQYDASMPDSVTGIDTSYLNGDKSATSSTGPSDNGFIDSGPGNTGSGSFDFGNLPSGGNAGGSPLSFSPSSPLVTTPTAMSSGAGATGGDSNAFAPTSGVDLAGGFPDPTSSVAGTAPGSNFDDRFQPANAAVANGSFDPQGAAYSGNDGSGVDLASLPAGATPTVGSGSLGAPTPQVNPALMGNIGPTQFQAGATPDAGATAIGGDFGSNLNTAMTQTLANPGPAPAGSPTPALSTPSSKTGSDTGGGTFLDKLAGGAASQLTKNPLGILAAGGGLALNALQGNKDPEGLTQIRDAAANLKSTGSVLQTYLTTGTLPPGMQASVDLATKAAKARIIGNYASRGLSTDPTKNSALQQELSGVEQNAIVTAATLGDKLMSQGLSATGMANQLYTTIMNVDQARSKATGTAISNFAAALAGGQTSAKVAA